MDKRLERIEWNLKMMELEQKVLQLQQQYISMKQDMVAAPIDWAELNNKQDEIIKLNEEALAK